MNVENPRTPAVWNAPIRENQELSCTGKSIKWFKSIEYKQVRPIFFTVDVAATLGMIVLGVADINGKPSPELHKLAIASLSFAAFQASCEIYQLAKILLGLRERLLEQPLPRTNFL